MALIGLILIVVGLSISEPELSISRNQSVALALVFWTLWHIGVTLLAWCAWVSWGKNAMGAD